MDEQQGIALGQSALEAGEGFDFEAAFSGTPAQEQKGKRWLLKILAGPNSGAQMNLDEGKSYIVGSEASSCDIVLTDLSVSKQHLKLSLEQEGKLVLEDLKSRNGVLINGEKVETVSTQTGSALVTLGSTTLLLTDRQAQQKAIFTPPIPIKEHSAPQETTLPNTQPTTPSSDGPQARVTSSLKVGQLTGLLQNRWSFGAAIAGCVLLLTTLVLTLTLMRERPELHQAPAWENQVLSGLLEPYPFSFTFNAQEDRVALQGHVSSLAVRNEAVEKIKARLPQLDVDTHNLIIDDALCREFNQVLTRNWPEITLTSKAPGSFALSGVFAEQDQLDKLKQYMKVHFPFASQLEFDVLAVDATTVQVNRQLQEIAPGELVGQFRGQDLLIAGTIPPNKQSDLEKFIDDARALPGISKVENLSVLRSVGDDDQNAIDLSGRYAVNGVTRRSNIDVAVMINGRIVQRGDLLDEMLVLSIRSDAIILQRQGVRYRINYSGL